MQRTNHRQRRWWFDQVHTSVSAWIYCFDYSRNRRDIRILLARCTTQPRGTLENYLLILDGINHVLSLWSDELSVQDQDLCKRSRLNTNKYGPIDRTFRRHSLFRYVLFRLSRLKMYTNYRKEGRAIDNNQNWCFIDAMYCCWHYRGGIAQWEYEKCVHFYNEGMFI